MQMCHMIVFAFKLIYFIAHKISIYLLLLFLLFSESGYFIPKAYYTIDSNGARSELSLISPNIVSIVDNLKT